MKTFSIGALTLLILASELWLSQWRFHKSRESSAMQAACVFQALE
jgi:hypothetical protein